MEQFGRSEIDAHTIRDVLRSEPGAILSDEPHFQEVVVLVVVCVRLEGRLRRIDVKLLPQRAQNIILMHSWKLGLDS
jgi:hypothetical protein